MRSPEGPAPFRFPFFGAGEATYFEWAEVHVRFTREPTDSERRTIAGRVPQPLRDSVVWSGRQLMVASDQFAHLAIIESYPADPGEEDDYGSRFIFAAESRVVRFNRDIDEWLRFAHGTCPVLAAYRAEDGESDGTALSDWHTWSLRQLDRLLPELESTLTEPAPSSTFPPAAAEPPAQHMLRGILDMAQRAGTLIPGHWSAWLAGSGV